MKTIRFAAAFVAALLLVPPAVAKDDDVDPAAREWSQARGSAGRTGSSAVEPLRSDPVEAWRKALPGPLVAEPVSWGGVVFAAAQKDKARKLLAFRAATGEPLGEKDLGSGGRIGLATWQGVVIVGESNQIRTFPHQGTKFGAGWAARGVFSAPPCVYRGWLFVCDGGELVAMDVMRGGAKASRTPVAAAAGLAGFEETKNLKIAPVGGAVGVYRNRADGVVYAVNVATVDTVALLSRTRVDDIATKPQLRYTMTSVLGTYPGAIPETDRWDMVPARIEAEGAKGMGAWVVLSPRPFNGGSIGKFVPDDASARGVDLATPLAVIDTVAYSFNKSGDLKSWRADGKTETLISADKSPPGSKPGPATRAGGIVFLGNYAFDPGEGRTIWTLKTPPATPIVPVGDRRLVYATESELVCVADAAAPVVDAASAPADSAGTAPEATAPAGTPKLPGDEDCVVLDDGRQFDADFERTPTMLTIRPKDGAASFEVPLTQVVVAQKGGEVEVKGDDTAACKVWRLAVRGAYCDALQSIFQEYAKSSMVDEARRVEQRMRDAGASEARLQKLGSSLNGKVPRADAAKAKKLGAQEETARAAAIEGYLRGVDWCAKREFAVAGTVLVADVAKIKGGADADLAARTKALIPDGFPWKGAPDDAQQWAEWAQALLPSGATFLTSDDDAWGRLTNEPWKSQRPLGFRTRNMLLYCMDQDPAVCGKSLFLGEGTVRSLQVLLNAGAADPVSSDAQRLEVRIHRNRKAYLEEQSATGAKAMEWSGGYFSPRENISRFYVDRGERDSTDKGRERGTSDRGGGGGGGGGSSGGGDMNRGQPDMKELGRVLTHELTHHYMEMRWMNNRGGGGGAGYWVIEGMATFVENQAVQMDRRGFSFDDRTVEDLDALATIEGQGGLFKAERFVDMNHGDFDKLNNTPFIRVKLRSSTGDKHFSERGLWYAQAGALSFFFLHERGAEGRERFVSYVRQHYQGSAPRPGWAALGFESAEDLDKEFFGFLKKLRGG